MDNFVFYASYLDAINELPNDSQLRLYQAITNFAFKGIEPNLKGVENAIFILIKQQIELNHKKAIGGRKGGRPKKNPEKNHRLLKEKTIGFEKENPKVIKEEKAEKKEKEKERTKEKVINNIYIKKEKKEEKEEILPTASQTQQPSAIIPKVVKKSPQQRIFDYFANEYKALTGLKYLPKRSEFINLTDLIHKNGEELVKKKIQWFEIGCLNSVFWFSKDVNCFTIGNLVRNWNAIMPIKTEEQKKAEAEKKKEEERMKRVLAEAQKLREERSK